MKLSFLLALASITTLALTCEAGNSFEIVNESNSPVVLEIRYGSGRAETLELASGEEWGIFVPEGGYSPAFRVLDSSGRELEKVFLSWEEMVDIDFRYTLR